MLGGEWTNELHGLEVKMIVEMASMGNLSPKVIYGCRQIVLREKCFSCGEILQNTS